MSSTLAISRLAIACAAAGFLSGCAVVSVAGTAVSLAATAAGVAVDATVGTAKFVGNAVMPSSKPEGQ